MTKWKQILGQEPAEESFNMDVDEEQPGRVEQQNSYAPFTSELDWRIAKWVVQDGPGHKAFDHLLSIPGVSLNCVDLFNYF